MLDIPNMCNDNSARQAAEALQWIAAQDLLVLCQYYDSNCIEVKMVSVKYILCLANCRFDKGAEQPG